MKYINICILLISLLLVTLPAAGATDQIVHDLIDTIRPVAQAVVVDGLGSDWVGIPVFPDPPGDAGGDASRDITSVAIAPLDDALLVRIETAGSPSTADLAFWLHIDVMGQQWLDLELGLYLGWPDILWIYEEGQPAVFMNWDHTVTVINDVVEARIPWDLLDPVLPASMQGRLSGPAARSWIRVTPYTVDGGVVDWGAAVASYRLTTTPFQLDPDLPAGWENTVELPPPLEGAWYVGQGAFGIGSHSGYWGYDLHVVDNALHPDDPFESPDNTDYFSYGETVRAPLGGTVWSMEDGWPDLDPRTWTVPATPSNWIFLDIGGGIGLLFSHLKENTISVAPSQAVAAGDLLGEVGNSGSTSWAHLHLEGQEIGGGFPSVPLAFTGVEVGLNPVDNDPWRRHLDTWGIREGFLVAPATVGCSLTCTPSGGTLPFSTIMAVSMSNDYAEQTRRIAGRLDVTTANGQTIPSWRAGFTNVAPGGGFFTSWNQSIPALGSLVGSNLFRLQAADVSPAPYNQPPYPPAGHTDTDACTVTGYAP